MSAAALGGARRPARSTRNSGTARPRRARVRRAVPSVRASTCGRRALPSRPARTRCATARSRLCRAPRAHVRNCLRRSCRERPARRAAHGRRRFLVRAAAVPRDGLQRAGGDALLHAAGFAPLYGHERTTATGCTTRTPHSKPSCRATALAQPSSSIAPGTRSAATTTPSRSFGASSTDRPRAMRRGHSWHWASASMRRPQSLHPRLGAVHGHARRPS